MKNTRTSHKLLTLTKWCCYISEILSFTENKTEFWADDPNLNSLMFFSNDWVCLKESTQGSFSLNMNV